MRCSDFPHCDFQVNESLRGGGAASEERDRLVAVHLCPKCGAPLEARADGSRPSHFDALGTSLAGLLGPSGIPRLEKNYYLLSRSLHPDRFGAARPPVRVASEARMSWINEAHSALKDSRSRRDYLVELAGAAGTAGTEGLQDRPKNVRAAPLAEAAEWFELQEAIEDGVQGTDALLLFEGRLKQATEQLESELQSLEQELANQELSTEKKAEYANQLRQALSRQSTLDSLRRDVARTANAKKGQL